MIINAIYPKWSDIVLKHTTQKSGDLFIAKSYLAYETSTPPVENVNFITNKVLSNVSVMLYNINEIAVKINDTFDVPVTYNRVYFCNANDDILFVVDTTLKQNILSVYEDFLIKVNDTGVVIE